MIVISSHILEELNDLATNVLVMVAGRLAASGHFREIRRLMTDRPHTFTIRSSDDRQLAAALLADPSVFGVELTPTGIVVRTADRGAMTRTSRALARDARAFACSRFVRRTSRSRASSPTSSTDDRPRSIRPSCG